MFCVRVSVLSPPVQSETQSCKVAFCVINPSTTYIYSFCILRNASQNIIQRLLPGGKCIMTRVPFKRAPQDQDRISFCSFGVCICALVAHSRWHFTTFTTTQNVYTERSHLKGKRLAKRISFIHSRPIRLIRATHFGWGFGCAVVRYVSLGLSGKWEYIFFWRVPEHADDVL